MTDEPTHLPDTLRAAAGTQGPDPGLKDEPAPVSETPQQSSDTERPGQEAPLITAIEIENFKGIGRPVRIDLRPITLLFGRNSAGKSTVLHALCYAHEILSHRNVDARRTSLGGDQIDLGGFRQFVHRHELTRSVRLRFDLNLGDRELPELAGDLRLAPFTVGVGIGRIKTGWLELTVCWSEERREPILSRYEVGVNGETVGRITAPASGAKANLLANLSHPMLDHDLREASKAELGAKLERLRAQLPEAEAAAAPPQVGQVRETAGPGWFGQAYHHTTVCLPGSSALPSFGHHFHIERREGVDEDYHERWHCVSTLLVGIGGFLRDALTRYRYLGPLRNLHPAGGAEREQSGSRWADGSAAWDLLNRHARPGIDRHLDDWIESSGPVRPRFVGHVSRWLSQEDRLDTGYALRVRSVVQLSGRLPLVRVLNRERRQYLGILGETLARQDGMSLPELHDMSPDEIVKTAPPNVLAALFDAIAGAPVQQEVQLETVGSGMSVRTSDIGVGISQILPVVVAALDPDCPAITAIEQPELHVHPRLQVELGDLFAQSVEKGGIFLIETHSEHLMLRLLRRIEETASGELPEGKPALKPDQVSVVYVDQVEGEVRATRIRIDETGEFIDRWPQGFFDERTDELF